MASRQGDGGRGPADFRAYVEKLAEVSGVAISTFDDMIAALRKRHDFFAAQGCKLSDHGIEEFYAEDYTDAEIKAIFNKVYGGAELTKEEILKFKSAMLIAFGEMDWEKGWTQQFHYGPSATTTVKCSNCSALTPVLTLSVSLLPLKQWLSSSTA